MKLLVTALLIGGFASLAAAEDCKGSCAARRNQCDQMTAAVVANVRGMTVAPTRGDEQNVELWHMLKDPSATDVTLFCATSDKSGKLKDDVAIDAKWQDTFPPAPYFDLLAQAGSIVTGHPVSAIRSGAMKCHQQALADDDHMRETSIDGVTYQCKSGEDWGGTDITVFKEQPDEH